MKILLIRHAESENNLKLGLPKEEYQASRSADPGITEKGIAQTERLGLYLLRRKLRIKQMYCSGLVRSIQTAAILQKILKINLEIKVPIHEVGGVYRGHEVETGKGRTWIQEQYPSVNVPVEVTEEGWFFQKTKETRHEALDRARLLVQEFSNWAMEGRWEHDDWIALVSHGAFMDLLLAVLLDRKEDSKLKITHANTGLTAFDFHKDGSNQLLFLNSADHLDDDFLALTDCVRNSHAVDYELDETEPIQRSVSEGYDLLDKVKNLKIHNKAGNNLQSIEEEDCLSLCKRQTYDQDPEETDKIQG